MITGTFEKSFDTEKVLRLMGAKRGRRPSNSTQRRIKNLKPDLKKLLKPSLDYRRFALDSVDGKSIQLADGTRFSSRKLAKAVGNAEEIYCFIATVGPKIDEEIQRLMKEKRYADAYVLDAVGSISAEDVVEKYYRHIAQKAEKEGRAVTLRFSPGYCDWPLEQQRLLFATFSDRTPVGVSLSQSCLMSPRKSVSGLFGILPSGTSGVDPTYNPCVMCRKHDCIARRSH
jgi:hypothetical protein